MALMLAAYAGSESYSGKDLKQTVPPPCPEFYADYEFNIGLHGILGFSAKDHNDQEAVAHLAGGGGLDVKYFFRRYFGVGITGFGLFNMEDDNDRFQDELAEELGFDIEDNRDDETFAVLATFTLRYPFPCSRFSPFLSWGAGGYWHGGERDLIGFEDDDDGGDFFIKEGNEATGHIGGFSGAGVEYRFSPHVSAIGEFQWHLLEGEDNNFGMVKAGINFAF